MKWFLKGVVEMKRMLRYGVLGLLGLLLCVESSQAGGLYLYEVGSPDVGLAAAGYAARAADASTAFTNPAGMTRLKQPSLMLGVQPMYLHLEFNPDSNTSSGNTNLPLGGSADDGDSSGWLPSGGLFYVQPVNDNLALGLAVAGYFGLSLDYGNNWVGRYYVQETELQALAIQPAVAWQINDQLSVGAGVAALNGTMKYNAAVNNIDPDVGDGRIRYEDNAWAVQYNLGVLYEPVVGTRFGLTYLSQGNVNFSDKIKLKGIGPRMQEILDNTGRTGADLDININMPQAVMFSVYHQYTDKLALMANLGWQDWSRFGFVDIGIYSLNSTELTAKYNFKDTWHVALGGEYRVSEPWLLTAGIAYDSNMLHSNEVSPVLPVGETWRFALGSRYSWSQDLTLGAAYELAWGGGLDVDLDRGPLAGQLSGSYDNVAVHFLSLNAEWRF
jgi:long-chain fatty acid transport protein